MRKKKELKEGEFDKDRYCTPPETLELVRMVDKIALDPCGDPEAVVDAEVTVMLPEHWDATWGGPPDSIVLGNGLEVPWAGIEGLIYCNPPYSAPAPWVRKALTEADRMVLLLPGNPDIGWFHSLCKDLRTTVLVLEGRIHFLENGKPATSPRQGNVVALISSRPADHIRFREVFASFGVFIERPAGAEEVVRRIEGAPSKLDEAVRAYYQRVLAKADAPPTVSPVDLAIECLEHCIANGNSKVVDEKALAEEKRDDAVDETKAANELVLEADVARRRAEALLADVRERLGKALRLTVAAELKREMQTISDECGGVVPAEDVAAPSHWSKLIEVLTTGTPPEHRVAEALRFIQKVRA